MQIPSALGSASYGIQKGLAEMNKNAAQIAGAVDSQNSTDLAKPLVDLQNNRMQIEVSAKVEKSVDNTIGSLLDAVA
jgi:hypothetical protein